MKSRKLSKGIILACLITPLFIGMMPVKAETLYIVYVYGKYIYAHNSHDGGSTGEFMIQAKLRIDGSYTSTYSGSEHDLKAGEEWSGSELLIDGLLIDANDRLYTRLKEIDGWPNPDDVIIDWEYEINPGIGVHNYEYSELDEGQGCRVKVRFYIDWNQ